MLNYPSFDRLKQIYPTVSVNVLKAAFQDENSVAGNMIVNGSKHSEYKFKGQTVDDLFYSVLKAHHFIHQKTGVNAVTGEKTAPVAAKDTNILVEEKVRLKVWVINDTTVERYRVNVADLQSYLDRGFEAYRKTFATWVDKKRIEDFSASAKANARAAGLESLKKINEEKGVGQSGLTRQDYKGSRRMINTDGVQKRVLACDVDKRVSEGWVFCDKTAKKNTETANTVNKRVVNAKTGEKKTISAKDVNHFLSNGWTFAKNNNKRKAEVAKVVAGQRTVKKSKKAFE